MGKSFLEQEEKNRFHAAMGRVVVFIGGLILVVAGETEGAHASIEA